MTGWPPIAALAAEIRAGRRSAEATVREALARARADTTRSFIMLLDRRALADARRVDRKVAAGGDPGPLAGVPFAVKSVFDMAGEVTLAGAAMHLGDPPAARDAELVAQLVAAGAVPVGLTNMDPLAYGYTSENTAYGSVLNPLDPARTAGGSSGGSAAAVAAGMVPLALGSDTNGSVRVPASLCGVAGLKPTFGALDRRGLYPFVASLDHAGFFAADAADLSEVARVLGLRVESAPPRVARLAGWFDAHAGLEAVAASRAAAAALGAGQEVVLDAAPLGRRAAFLITAAEAGDLHRPRLAADPGAFDPLVRDRLIAGALMPAHWYLHAQKARARVIAGFAALLARADLLVLPATPLPAPRLDAPEVEIAGTRQPARTALGLMVQPITLAGLPVAVVPWRDGALPVGVQLVAAPGREDHALAAARALEAAGFGRARNRTEARA